MTINCPECGEPFTNSFGRMTCVQCKTTIIVRCLDKDTQELAVEVVDDRRPSTTVREDSVDLQMGVASEEGEVRGLCALCETFVNRFDLKAIHVGKLIFTKKLIAELQPDGIVRKVVRRICIPLIRKAFCCEGCYGPYLRATLFSETQKKDGTLFHRSFVTLPFDADTGTE